MAVISSITLISSRWWPIAVALVGAWVTARNLLRVYREHCAEDFAFAEDEWSSADYWIDVASMYEHPAWSKLHARFLRKADECERQAARWFVKGCGG